MSSLVHPFSDPWIKKTFYVQTSPLIQSHRQDFAHELRATIKIYTIYEYIIKIIYYII
jgi:hypothetical protein